MARFIGKDGVVTVGGTVVGEIQDFEYTDERAVARAPSMGQGYVGHGIGAPAYTGTVRCLMDSSDTGQIALDVTSEVGLTLQPEGVGSGLPQIAWTAVVITSIPRTVPSEEWGTIEFSWAANSAADKTAQT